jgi:hypothetical protein
MILVLARAISDRQRRAIVAGVAVHIVRRASPSMTCGQLAADSGTRVESPGDACERLRKRNVEFVG